MTTASGEKPLELSVRNFGPIAEGTVELRPFTVFVGPSNTGKSYLATLIYALHQFFGLYVETLGHDRNAGPITTFGSALEEFAKTLDFSTEEMSIVHDWVKQTHLPGVTNAERLERAAAYGIPDSVAILTRRVVNGIGHESPVVDEQIARCFGIYKTANLITQLGDSTCAFSVSRKVSTGDERIDSFRLQFNVDLGGVNITSQVPDNWPIPTYPMASYAWFRHSRNDVEPPQDENAIWFLNTLAGAALSTSVTPMVLRGYYLPADRAGAVRSHSALTGTLISRASRPSVASQQPTLTGIYGDFLEGVVGLGGLPTKTTGPLDTLADSMERNILGGEIWVDSNFAGYPSFFYRPKGWDQDIPLMNASSMVSELAPVVLYLRHVVQPGETLIIEEPESALHPAMQVELTRLLAAAVKAGIRIIITTHSEWILEELANLVLMSELPVEQRHGFEGADLVLNPDDVGAWLFEPDAEIGGTVIKEIPLDKEMGNFPSGFGLVTTDLYNRYTRIANRIEMLKEE